VDDRGNFRIDGLPPDRYNVSLTAKGRVSIFPHVPSTTVNVPDKGCARFNFIVVPFGSPEELKIPNDASPGTETRDRVIKKFE
jgi:hypothetical protein